MSLRARLAVLYTAVVGGILLLFGMTVYIIVSVALTSQGDITLNRAAIEIIRTTRIETPETGNVRVIILPALDLAADVYVQVWGRNNELQATSPNISAYKKSSGPRRAAVRKTHFP